MAYRQSRVSLLYYVQRISHDIVLNIHWPVQINCARTRIYSGSVCAFHEYIFTKLFVRVLAVQGIKRGVLKLFKLIETKLTGSRPGRVLFRRNQV